jgi:hypothetical protein
MKQVLHSMDRIKYSLMENLVVGDAMVWFFFQERL